LALSTILFDLDSTLLDNDIEPARSLGIKTWWITSNDYTPKTSSPNSDRQGSLSDLLVWIEVGELN